MSAGIMDPSTEGAHHSSLQLCTMMQGVVLTSVPLSASLSTTHCLGKVQRGRGLMLHFTRPAHRHLEKVREKKGKMTAPGLAFKHLGSTIPPISMQHWFSITQTTSNTTCYNKEAVSFLIPGWDEAHDMEYTTYYL